MVLATFTDRVVGSLIIGVAGLLFFYYTIWVIILPFLEEGHFLHQYFLPRSYAIAIPVGAGIVLVSAVSVFVGLVLMKEKSKKKKT